LTQTESLAATDDAPTICIGIRGTRRFVLPSQTAERERVLLLIATAFLFVGAFTLAIASPTGSSHITQSARRWSFVVCSFVAAFATAHLLLNRYLPCRDPFLLPIVALLSGWGLLLVGRSAINFLVRQTVWLLISTVALLIIARFGGDLRWLRRFRYTWLFGGLALLAATLVLGVNPSGYGLRLWLGAWGVYFQPSELLKLLMIVYLASYLAERKDLLISERWKVGRWRLPPLAYVGPLLAMQGIAIVLLAWQQDLGTAMLFSFTFLAMLYLATGQWEYIAAGLGLFIVLGLAGYLLSDRVAVRIDGWLNPWPDAADRTFQIVQSLLAFGAGGIFGRGLGLGDPSYIPAVHTDFVFTAAGEEFGLMGALVVIGLYAVLLLRGFRIAARTSHPFEYFLAAGLTSGLVIQAWVIMAGNARLAPIAGVTLPFISYGGSSLLISFVTLGLLLRISSPAAAGGAPRPTTVSPPLPAHTHTSLIRLACALSLALALLAATCGYWTAARADYLDARDDNPRRVLYEQSIVRGHILDRNGALLADVEVDDDGIVTRRYPVPEAAPAVGYASLRYGTGGIEAAFENNLRGESDQTVWQVAWNELLHRPPYGRDVQLTIETTIQVQAQQALEGQAGAAVLLNATTGEILALASSPTFDPETLDRDWEALSEDPAAPLLNRATQGLYQPGGALQTVLLGEALTQGLAKPGDPVPDATRTLRVNGTSLECSLAAPEPSTLAAAYAAACPGPFADLGQKLGASGLETAITSWGLTTPPSLEIPTEASDWAPDELSTGTTLRDEAIGQGDLTVSPLHMAMVAGTLANDGLLPAPRLVLRVQSPDRVWQESRSNGAPLPIIEPYDAQQILNAWQRIESDIAYHWSVAIAGKDQSPHAWFLGVTPLETPRYAAAVLLEHPSDPHRVVEVGEELLASAQALGR
jgi:cell division protein FtsW (lipid II flippase)